MKNIITSGIRIIAATTIGMPTDSPIISGRVFEFVSVEVASVGLKCEVVVVLAKVDRGRSNISLKSVFIIKKRNAYMW